MAGHVSHRKPPTTPSSARSDGVDRPSPSGGVSIRVVQLPGGARYAETKHAELLSTCTRSHAGSLSCFRRYHCVLLSRQPACLSDRLSARGFKTYPGGAAGAGYGVRTEVPQPASARPGASRALITSEERTVVGGPAFADPPPPPGLQNKTLQRCARCGRRADNIRDARRRAGSSFARPAAPRSNRNKEPGLRFARAAGVGLITIRERTS
jgi:hypothetical protein